MQPAFILGTMAFCLYAVLYWASAAGILPTQAELSPHKKEVRKQAYLGGHKSGIFRQWQERERAKAGVPEPSQGGPAYKKFSQQRKASKEAAYKQSTKAANKNKLAKRKPKQQEQGWQKGSECKKDCKRGTSRADSKRKPNPKRPRARTGGFLATLGEILLGGGSGGSRPRSQQNEAQIGSSSPRPVLHHKRQAIASLRRTQQQREQQAPSPPQYVRRRRRWRHIWGRDEL